jgi:hypothetical protein
MSHLFLSHLSKNNNCPKLVQKLFDEHAAGVKMIVASRYQQTAVYHINNQNVDVSIQPLVTSPQLSLAFG